MRTELSLGPGNYGRDGVEKVIAQAKAMGIDISHFQPVVSTTLGTNGVHPLEMAQAYSVIAADGVLHPAEFVSKIVGPNGKILYQNNSSGTRVLTPQVARSETDALTEVLKDGTAAGVSIGRPAAGKTGTTDSNQDAWFIGYTPQLTTAVWMGDPNAETPMTNVGGIQVFGATYPARRLGRVHEGGAREHPAGQLHTARREVVAAVGVHRRQDGPRLELVLLGLFELVFEPDDRPGDRAAGDCHYSAAHRTLQPPRRP